MKTILLIVLLSLQTIALADSELIKMFSSTFSSHYVPAKCGDNILGLLQRAENKRLNLNQARIIEISNYGFSVFGMVNVEFARASGPHGAPGERNWYHHVVLEKDGLIYDFDFGNSPQVTTIRNYFEKMFLIEKKKSEGGEFYVGREEKLKNYEIVVRPGLTTMHARRDRVVSPEGEKMRLQKYLDTYAK